MDIAIAAALSVFSVTANQVTMTGFNAHNFPKVSFDGDNYNSAVRIGVALNGGPVFPSPRHGSTRAYILGPLVKPLLIHT